MSRRRITTQTLLLYAVAVIAVTLFPLRMHPAAYWADEPWWTMLRYIPGSVDAPSFILNVIMFIPLGILLPQLWPRLDQMGRLALRAGAASLAIELAQLVLGLTVGSRRTVDVNDLIANTGGALVGLLILRLAVPVPAHRAAPPARVSDPAVPAQRPPAAS
jgi:glycopeptide antibiotics resistance protein